MINNHSHRKDIVISFRIDNETAEIIAILKKDNIKWRSEIHDLIKKRLRKLAKINPKKEKLPF